MKSLRVVTFLIFMLWGQLTHSQKLSLESTSYKPLRVIEVSSCILMASLQAPVMVGDNSTRFKSLLLGSMSEVVDTENNESEAHNEGKVILGDEQEAFLSSSFFWATLLVITILLLAKNKQRNSHLLELRKKELAATREEMEQLKKELLEAKDMAARASHSKTDFLANMSHEIRTPMNAILGFSELLKAQVTEPKSQHFVNSIEISGRSLLRLINDILDLSKVEAGKFELSYRAVNPINIFGEMEVIFSQKISQKGLAFLVEIDEDLPKGLLLDETRIRQVLFNLIGNAIKFTEKGFIKLAVYSKENESDSSRVSLIFTVEDTGIGIPEENRPHVFGAFEQINSQNHVKYGGTGLGLAISKRLVELMDGEILVKESTSGGALFEVLLHNVDLAISVPELEEQDKICEISSFKNATVLVVDDVQMNRDLLENYLIEYNATVQQAVNGEEAVFLADAVQPDAILMDIKMPIMDGLEATKIIKSKERTKHIPVIIVTASVLEEHEKIVREVCDDYLRKPVSKTDLMRVLSKYLEHESEMSEKKPAEKARDMTKTEVLESLCDAGIIAAIDDLDVATKIDALLKEMVIQDLMVFASEMLEVSQKHESSLFSDWASSLNGAITECDMLKTKLQLESFREIYK